MQYLKIVNWEKYQHYSKRNPPWIKLHNQLLDNYDYGCLQDASKLLLMTLYLLASRTENNIPADQNWVRTKGMLRGTINWEPLISAGFITLNGNSASDSLASCKQNGGTETETETENIKNIYITPLLGEFVNVKLTEEQLRNLKTKFGDDLAQKKIQDLSSYIASKGKKYKSHYATILNWLRKEGFTDGNREIRKRPSNLFLDSFSEKDESSGD